MLSDIEIINSSTMKEIRELTGRYGINDDELYAYGKYIAKAEFELLKRVENRPDGKLILVTAITPTPAGEGKSTITIGLVDVLNRLGKKSTWVHPRTFFRTRFWCQRRSCGWRLCPGKSDGRPQFAFYRRHSCNHNRKQLSERLH